MPASRFCQKAAPVMTSKFHDYIRRHQAEDAPCQPALAEVSPLDRPLSVTFFGDAYATRKTQETTTLRALVERISTTQAPSKDRLPWLKLAAFGDHKSERGSFRNDANVLEIHGIEADYDGERLTLDRARTVLAGAGIAAVLYTSPSHRDDAPRWRVLCPTSQALPPADRSKLVGRVNGLFVGALAAESFTLSQSYYFGSVAGNALHQVIVVEGRAIDLADDLDKEAIGRPAKPTIQDQPPRRATPRAPLHDGGSHYGLAALADECSAIWGAPEGAKHATLNKAAYAIGGLVTAGELQEGAAFAELSAALEQLRPYCKDWRAAQGTLRRAFEDGKRDQRQPPEPMLVTPADEIHPAAALLAKMQTKAARSAPAPEPGLMDVDGALKLFVDYCEATAFSSQPFLALGAGICAIGALAGRRYRTRTDLRTNVYAIGIADSGGGKDHARGVIKRVFFGANLGDYLGGNKIASGSGLLSALGRHPSMLFQIDEMGLWLQNVLGRNASSHQREIWANLTELFTSANLPFGGTEYANQKEAPRVVIHQPNACLYGTSVPNEFWAALQSGALQNGSIARFLVFLSPCNYPDTPLPDARPVPAALTEAFQAIAAGVPGHDYGGNLASPMQAGTHIEPYPVPETAGAAKALRDLKAKELAWKRRAEGTYATAMIARLFEQAYKLALIRAISRAPGAPVIEQADVQWGEALARHCIDTLLREAERFVSDNDYEAKVNKALDIIRRHGPISQRDMFRKGFKLPERERAEILRTLVDTGQAQAIAQEAETQGGRPTIRYLCPIGNSGLSD